VQSVEAVRRLPSQHVSFRSCTAKTILLPWYRRSAELASRAKQYGVRVRWTPELMTVTEVSWSATWFLRDEFTRIVLLTIHSNSWKLDMSRGKQLVFNGHCSVPGSAF
jgi:hypothetical protein